MAEEHPQAPHRKDDEDDGGSIADAVRAENTAPGGGDLRGPGAGPDAQSAGAADTRDPEMGRLQSDIGGGADVGESDDS